MTCGGIERMGASCLACGPTRSDGWSSEEIPRTAAAATTPEELSVGGEQTGRLRIGGRLGSVCQLEPVPIVRAHRVSANARFGQGHEARWQMNGHPVPRSRPFLNSMPAVSEGTISAEPDLSSSQAEIVIAESEHRIISASLCDGRDKIISTAS